MHSETFCAQIRDILRIKNLSQSSGEGSKDKNKQDRIYLHSRPKKSWARRLESSIKILRASQEMKFYDHLIRLKDHHLHTLHCKITVCDYFFLNFDMICLESMGISRAGLDTFRYFSKNKLLGP